MSYMTNIMRIMRIQKRSQKIEDEYIIAQKDHNRRRQNGDVVRLHTQCSDND